MLGGDMINLVCSAGFRISVVWECSASDEQVHLKGRLFSENLLLLSSNQN